MKSRTKIKKPRQSANIPARFCGVRFGAQTRLAQKTKGGCTCVLPPFAFRARLDGKIINKPTPPRQTHKNFRTYAFPARYPKKTKPKTKTPAPYFTPSGYLKKQKNPCPQLPPSGILKRPKIYRAMKSRTKIKKPRQSANIPARFCEVRFASAGEAHGEKGRRLYISTASFRFRV